MIAQQEITTNKSLQGQLSFRPAFDIWVWEHGVSKLTGEVDRSAYGLATF